MSDQPRFVSAAAFALETLAEIFTRSFEGYFYPGTTTALTLAQRVRLENLDLHRSLVMLVGDQPAGIVLLGLRGERAWCGGFGVTLPWRGRGLAHPLALAMIEQARQAGGRVFGLEALTRNERAIKTYTRAGLRVLRDLSVLEWHAPAEQQAQESPTDSRASQQPSNLAALEPAALLEHFAALHPVPAAWQRDLPTLLVRAGLHGLALLDARQPIAYVLFQEETDDRIRIQDLGATRVSDAEVLLKALRRRSKQLVSVNEPADSPLIAAFQSLGFVESDRQHEMIVDLA